jgi:hypothetical protein
MSKGRFQLDATVPGLSLDHALKIQSSPVLGSDNAYVNFCVSLPDLDPEPTLDSRNGCFFADSRMPKYNMLWGSRRDFDIFLAQEQSSSSVEFLKSQTQRGLAGKYTERVTYLCARHGCPTVYVKKNLHWEHKVPSKITDCTASLTIKTYPGTPFHQEKRKVVITVY